MPELDSSATVEPLERRVIAHPATIVGELRRELVGYAKQAGASPRTCESVALAVSEALTNVVRHAYVGAKPGVIMVEARIDGDNQLVVRISDEGLGLVPRADSPGLGLGMGLMAQTADEFTVSNRHDAPGTVVSLRFSLAAGSLV